MHTAFAARDDSSGDNRADYDGSTGHCETSVGPVSGRWASGDRTAPRDRSREFATPPRPTALASSTASTSASPSELHCCLT